MSNILEKELATYQQKLPDLLPNEGKFVLIHGDEVAGVWDTYEDALKTGYEKFRLNPFLVKQILWADKILNFTRDVISNAHVPKPARTDENKSPATDGLLHGLSEQAHKQFLAFQKRFGQWKGERKDETVVTEYIDSVA